MTGPAMHPLVLEVLVRDRHAELAREIRRARQGREVRRRREPSALRRRVGWTLVEAGLRLTAPRA